MSKCFVPSNFLEIDLTIFTDGLKICKYSRNISRLKALHVVISSMQEKSYLKVNQPITGENGAHLSICLPMTILKLLSHTEKKILVLHTCYMLKLLSLWR